MSKPKKTPKPTPQRDGMGKVVKELAKRFGC